MMNPTRRLTDSCCLFINCNKRKKIKRISVISFCYSLKKGGNKCNHSNSNAIFHISKRATAITNRNLIYHSTVYFLKYAYQVIS